jgi:hypothetical protein
LVPHAGKSRRSINFNQQFLSLLILLVLSAIIFVFSSETALKLENQNYFDFANPVYVFNVLTAFGSMATGGFSLLALHWLATQELEK